MNLNLLSIIVTIVSMIVAIITTFLSIKASSTNSTIKISTSYSKKYSMYVNHHYSAASSPDNIFGTILIAMLVAGSFYSQYAHIITIIITLIGLLSIIIIGVALIHRPYHDKTPLILLCASYIICFLSIFFFLHPIFSPAEDSVVIKLFSSIYPILGGMLICINFIRPLYLYILKGNNLTFKESMWYLVVAIASIFITSGFLLFFISSI